MPILDGTVIKGLNSNPCIYIFFGKAKELKENATRTKDKNKVGQTHKYQHVAFLFAREKRRDSALALTQLIL